MKSWKMLLGSWKSPGIFCNQESGNPAGADSQCSSWSCGDTWLYVWAQQMRHPAALRTDCLFSLVTCCLLVGLYIRQFCLAFDKLAVHQVVIRDSVCSCIGDATCLADYFGHLLPACRSVHSSVLSGVWQAIVQSSGDWWFCVKERAVMRPFYLFSLDACCLLVGLYIRRFCLAFDKLSFSQVVIGDSMWTKGQWCGFFTCLLWTLVASL